MCCLYFFFFKQKTAYDMRISDWSSDVCSSDLDGLPAISSGRGNGNLDVRTLNIANNPFKPGGILVTSGTGGLYPPNIPVAIVVSRQDDGALARPLADPAKVDAVAVLRPYTPDNIEAQAVPATPPSEAP